MLFGILGTEEELLNSIATSKPTKIRAKSSKAPLPKPKDREFRGDFSSDEENEEKNEENRNKNEKNRNKIEKTAAEPPKKTQLAEGPAVAAQGPPKKTPLAEGPAVAAPELPNALKSEIYLAVKNGDAEIFEEILRNSQNDFQIGLNFYLNEQIGQDRFTLLHIASKAGHAGIIKTLLNVGCDPTTVKLQK